MNLHWHRRDLRVADNPALAAATDSGLAVSLFVLDDAVLAHAAPARVAYLRRALSSLRESYRDRGSDLLVARGDPETVLPDLATAVGADRVTWSVDYSGLARERDARVRKRIAAETDATVEAVHGELHHEPGSITTNEGTHYSVYSYFWNKWRDRPKADPVAAPTEAALASTDEITATLETADAEDHLISSADGIPTLAALGFDEPDADLPQAGTAAARERLGDFCEEDIYRYADRRDFPAEECTSRLSGDLKWGTVGIREVTAATEDALAHAPDTAAEDSVETFQSQLAWREFYMHVLDARPDVVTTNFKPYANPIEWRHDPEGLQAWKDGQTGYPIVDAGMRQLRAEAWMHNRVRMLVASFLTKDLLIDWREGYDWFRRMLLDHDTANDTGGWQWAASTGTDAQPYFRIFNPMTQGERYDPDATYIRRYVPELREAAPETIHRWTVVDQAEREAAAPDYPAPIVDHADRREEAIETFERARGG